jgi:hypothetical protein
MYQYKSSSFFHRHHIACICTIIIIVTTTMSAEAMSLEQPSYYTLVMGFVHAINWSDDLILYLGVFHGIVFALGLLALQNFNIGMAYLFMLCTSWSSQ